MSAKQQAIVSKTKCTSYNNIENVLSSLVNCCNPKNTELLQTMNHFSFFIKDCQTNPYEYIARDNTSNNKTYFNNMSSKGSKLKRRIMLEGDPKKTVCLSHFTMTFYTTKKRIE